MSAKIFEVHPRDPQLRAITQVVQQLREGALIIYPTDSGYAFGAALDNHAAAERIRRIRHLGSHHHFTLVCSDFAQLGQLVYLDNSAFRAIKAATPGPYTFVLPATREVPRRLADPKKKTVGVRIPDNRVAQALLRELGEPLLSSTLLVSAAGEEDAADGDDPSRPDSAPGEVADFPSWIFDQVDVIIDAGSVPAEPTTVIDLSSPTPSMLRAGAGDPARFA